MPAPSFYSDPHVQFLSQLLEEISAGHLQVPRFQRPMVWNWDRRRELLVSIRDGIPIGAIMVWRTARTAIECYQRLGPHLLSPPPEGATRQYLLDGVQRLSTLYGALHSSPPRDELSAAGDEDNEEELPPEEFELLAPRNFEVYFNLRTKDFHTGEEDDENGKDLMPLHLVFNSVALLKFQRELRGPAAEQFVESSDEIARAFRDYKIPIIPITTDDIEMATRTFQRINSQGAKMSETHMVHALTWSSNFDLQRQIVNIKRELLSDRGWGELDDDPILKSCKAALSLDVYKTNAQELSDKLKKNPHLIAEVGESLRRAARFLWEDCGVPAPELVPYSLQIVILAEAFRRQPNPSSQLRRLIFSWFWMTTYGELFAGMSGDRLQVALNDMREMVAREQPKWTWNRPFEQRPLRDTFDFRAARSKAFAFRLASVQNDVSGGRAGSQILADAGRKGFVQIIPWREGRHIFSSPANRFLVHPAEAGSLRDAVLTGSLSPDSCEKHVISTKALDALKARNFSFFVERRRLDILNLEDKFVTPLVRLFDASDLMSLI
jgi:Protein of unknown function DUF262